MACQVCVVFDCIFCSSGICFNIKCFLQWRLGGQLYQNFFKNAVKSDHDVDLFVFVSLSSPVMHIVLRQSLIGGQSGWFIALKLFTTSYVKMIEMTFVNISLLSGSLIMLLKTWHNFRLVNYGVMKVTCCKKCFWITHTLEMLCNKVSFGEKLMWNNAMYKLPWGLGKMTCTLTYDCCLCQV